MRQKPPARPLALAAWFAALLVCTGCAVAPAGGPDAGLANADHGTPAQRALRQTLSDALEPAGLSVLLMPDGQLQLNVPSDFSFGPDRADIRAEGRPVLDKVAASLNAPQFVAMPVRVVGHTDSQGSDAVNEALSLARATSVRRHLESKGIAASRLQAVGLGAREPVAPNDKAYGRTLNRRIEIYLQPAGAAH